MEIKTLTVEDMKIIDYLENKIFENISISNIKTGLLKKSYNWVYDSIKKMEKLNIIKVSKIGSSNFCKLNLDNLLCLKYLSLNELLKYQRFNLPRKNVEEIISSIPVKYFTFLITGSYAEAKQTKSSDLDIVIIVSDNEDTKKILTVIKNKAEFMVPEIHPYVFTSSEFLKMLLSDKENYGKMIFYKKIICFGAENYYEIMKEAVKNGFKG